MKANHSGQLPGLATLNTRRSPLRQRIVQASTKAGSASRRKQRNISLRAPNFPGTAAFDLNNDLEQVPYAKRRITTPAQSDSTLPSGAEEIFNMDPDAYHGIIMSAPDLTEEASGLNLSASFEDLFSDEVCAPYGNDSFREPSESLFMHGLDDLIPSVSHNQSLGLSQDPMPDCLPAASSAPQSITEQQLTTEVKSIYAGLAKTERRYVDIIEGQSRPERGIAEQQWTNLVALHKALLEDYHDFFAATQHPQASLALRSMAVNKAMPRHMWRQSMHAFLEFLRRHSLTPKRSLTLFGNLLAQTMDRFIYDIPELSREWDLIKDNLREYFITLRADGVDVPLSLGGR